MHELTLAEDNAHVPQLTTHLAWWLVHLVLPVQNIHRIISLISSCNGTSILKIKDVYFLQYVQYIFIRMKMSESVDMTNLCRQIHVLKMNKLQMSTWMTCRLPQPIATPIHDPYKSNILQSSFSFVVYVQL